MSESDASFERIARSIAQQGEAWARLSPDPTELDEPHPFETRNIHPDLPAKVRNLFDDGHYDNAVFEAFKYIETEVRRLSRIRAKVGFPLMMEAFNENDPKIRLNGMETESEVDEQKGYRHMFAGSSAGIRNPRGHDVDKADTLDEALDYLSVASLLLRKLDASGNRGPAAPS